MLSTYLKHNARAATMIKEEIRILKVFLKILLCKTKRLFFNNKIEKINTPIQVEIEVARGIIRNPNLLKKLILIVTFKKQSKKKYKMAL